jgi:hypothetical protein
MIKNFIYLDTQKMYSLSSQIFEGVTDYIINENRSDTQDSETQKGPIGSGKVLADVINVSEKSTEKKFLHDYSYTIFEKHLIDNNLVFNYEVPYLSAEELKKDTIKQPFIKVKGRATFNDANKITELFREFNSIGEALAYVTAFSELEKMKKGLEIEKASIIDPNQRLRFEKETKKKLNIKNLADSKGLQQDPEFLKNLELLTRYGFSNQFEIHQICNDHIFTSCLIRDFLRETEDLLVKKYSRKTEREITVFGLISQGFEKFAPDLRENKEFSNLKAGLLNIVEHLSNVEDSISGRQENEIIIDPVAAYFEL